MTANQKIVTSNELNQVRESLVAHIDYRSQEVKDDIRQEMKEVLTEFKSELFNKLDPILKEVVTNRQERTIINKRIEVLEEYIQN